MDQGHPDQEASQSQEDLPQKGLAALPQVSVWLSPPWAIRDCGEPDAQQEER